MVHKDPYLQAAEDISEAADILCGSVFQGDVRSKAIHIATELWYSFHAIKFQDNVNVKEDEDEEDTGEADEIDDI